MRAAEAPTAVRHKGQAGFATAGLLALLLGGEIVSGWAKHQRDGVAVFREAEHFPAKTETRFVEIPENVRIFDKAHKNDWRDPVLDIVAITVFDDWRAKKALSSSRSLRPERQTAGIFGDAFIDGFVWKITPYDFSKLWFFQPKELIAQPGYEQRSRSGIFEGESYERTEHFPGWEGNPSIPSLDLNIVEQQPPSLSGTRGLNKRLCHLCGATSLIPQKPGGNGKGESEDSQQRVGDFQAIPEEGGQVFGTFGGFLTGCLGLALGAGIQLCGLRLRERLRRWLGGSVYLLGVLVSAGACLCVLLGL